MSSLERVAVVIAGAKVHESLLLPDALEAEIVEPPNPHAGPTQHVPNGNRIRVRL